MTFFEKWENGESGYTNLSSFTTDLMNLYAKADILNRSKLETSFPEYFVKNLDYQSNNESTITT